jgi:membrane-associated phospholipid phosphatase
VSSRLARAMVSEGTGAADAAASRASVLIGAGALLAVLALLVLVAGVFGKAVTGVYHARVEPVDFAVAAWLHSLRSPWMDRTMWPLGWVVEMEPLAIGGGAVFVYLLARRRYDGALRIGVSLSGVGIMWLAVAHIVQRQRPNYWMIHDPSDIGYPSGHVMNIVVMSGLCMAATFPRLTSRWQRALLAGFWILFGLGVAASRIYTHAHFASDELAGFMMGVVWVNVVLRTLRARAGRVMDTTTAG